MFNWLWEVGLWKSEECEKLIQNLKDEDELGSYSPFTLEEIGEPAVDQLIQALDDDTKHIGREPSRVLGRLVINQCHRTLIEFLSDENKWVRREDSTA